MSLGLGTTSIFGTGCRYQVPTRTHEDTNGATQDLCVMVRMGDREIRMIAGVIAHRVLEGIMIKLGRDSSSFTLRDTTCHKDVKVVFKLDFRLFSDRGIRLNLCIFL